MPSVLVTDGDERAALAVVRSLGRAGYAVHVCGDKRRTLAGVSRRAAAVFAVPDPLRVPRDFVASVAAYVRTHAIDVILPITEPALLAVLSARASFGDAAIPFPSIETFRAASDKAALMGVASQLGLAVPRQWELVASGALANLDVSALPYPVVIKPGRSVGEHDGVRSKQGVRYASGSAELRARVAAMSPAAFPLLVQERVIGAGSGVFLLRWGGAIIASFAHRRIREKPPAGGVSVYAEAVPLDDTLREHSERLLDRLQWEGVAMIEYKIDTRTGVPYLMEINGRFWGSLQLAIDAGVDFPLLLVRLAMGERIAPQHEYREGTRGRWWWGEVDHVLARMRRSEAELALPPGSPSRGAVVRDFLARWRPHEHDAVFRLDDPLPFVYESARWIARK
jgi:predicted ATP-grasp superfamily ATP-dependent carboligase